MPALAHRLSLRQPASRQEAFEPRRPIEGRNMVEERTRRFVARAGDRDLPSEAVMAADFIQAALIFAESCAGHCETDLDVAVTDCETGETHCFSLSLAS